MALPPELLSFRERARRAIADHNPNEVVRRSRAIIGSSNIPDSEVAAQRAYKELQDGTEPSADDLRALEIVVRLLRPIIVTMEGQLGDLPTSAFYAEALRKDWNGFRSRVQRFLRSVGRVETARGVHIGTGFVSGAGELLTNRHVLAALSGGTGQLGANQARVSFKRELGAADDPGDVVPILGSLRVHPSRDAAILGISSGDRMPVPICLDPVVEGDAVATVGYPAEDQDRNPLFLQEVFGKNFGVKCAALGEVLLGSDGVEIFHDCSTTRGNSGSPIFSLRKAAVVGLHRSGFFMYRNEGIAVPEFARFIRGQ